MEDRPARPTAASPPATFARSARLAARSFLSVHARSVLREAAAHALRARIRPRLERSIEAVAAAVGGGAGEEGSPAEQEVPEVQVTAEDVDAVYALARRVGLRWAVKLVVEGLEDAAEVVRDATVRGRYLEVGGDEDEDDQKKRGELVVGEGCEDGTNGSAKDGAAAADVIAGDGEKRSSAPSAAPDDRENDVDYDESSRPRFMTPYAELCNIGYDPLPSSSPTQCPVPHPRFLSGGENTPEVRKWFRSQIDIIDSMAAEGRTMWPFDWEIVEDAARECVRRLHVNPTARRSFQDGGEEGDIDGKEETEGNVVSQAEGEEEGEEDELPEVTSKFVNDILKKRRIRRERAAGRCRSKRDDDLFESAPLPPLSRPASEDLPPSGEVSWSYEGEVVASIPPWERERLVKEMIHKEYWPEDMRRSAGGEGERGSSLQPRHTAQGALKRLAAMHQWEQGRTKAKRVRRDGGLGAAEEDDSPSHQPSKSEITARKAQYSISRKERLGPCVEEVKSNSGPKAREARLKGSKVVRTVATIDEGRGAFPFDEDGDGKRGAHRIDLDLGECTLEVAEAWLDSVAEVDSRREEQGGPMKRVSFAFRSLEVTLLERTEDERRGARTTDGGAVLI